MVLNYRKEYFYMKNNRHCKTNYVSGYLLNLVGYPTLKGKLCRV